MRDVTDDDAAAWSRLLSPPVLTPDGQWLAYLWSPYDASGAKPQRGAPLLVVRNTRDDTDRRHAIGSPGHDADQLKMSASGQWIAFMTDRTAVAVVETASGKQLEFPNTCAFSFVANTKEQILLEGCAAAEPGSTFDLTLRELGGDKAKAWKRVTEYALNARGRLALLGPNGLLTFDTTTGSEQVLEGPAAFHHLTWSQKGGALALLRRDTDGADILLTFTGLEGARPSKRAYSVKSWKNFPDAYAIATEFKSGPFWRPDAPKRVLEWRDDERGLFLYIQSVPARRGAAAPVASDLVLWHSRDSRLPRQKEVEAKYDVPRYELAFISLTDGRFVRLADESLQDVASHGRSRFVLGYDRSAYGWRNDVIPGLKAFQLRDYYVVDLQSGARSAVAKGLRVEVRGTLGVAPRISPDGSVVLYQDNEGDYVVHDLESGRTRNLTANLPTRFHLPGNDPRRGRLTANPATGAPALQGWSADGEYVLISDTHDVWALPLREGRVVNITGDGQRKKIIYDLWALTPGRDNELSESNGSQAEAVAIDKPLYFSITDLKTGRTGLSQRLPGQQANVLRWEDGRSRHYKAARADVHLVYLETTVDGGDYYLLGDALQPTKRLTDLYAQQREFNWIPKAKYLTFTTQYGESRAVLYAPVGAAEGQAYPTIVRIYETWPESLHGYVAPGSDNFLFAWLQRGYAVLLPDITPKLDEGGEAALKSVTAAVDAAVATGVVDRTRLALTGFSYGAFETYYIVSQTDMFKAAIAEAGMTNLISHYGGVDGIGRPTALISENSQPYLDGPWWANWDAFIRNSPLFHVRNIKTPLLIAHGDKDAAVAFSQAVELFNALRRLGTAPVVLLQYVAAPHDFAGNGDLMRRESQFLDHFLKGAPAPAWWADGASYQQGRAPQP